MEALLEVACFNPESVVIAQNAGADRVELCNDYDSGGITPAFEIIRKSREILSISLYVMIRPRGGNFIYSESEMDEMRNAVLSCKKNNVDGVVFGILTGENKIDVNRCTALAELAKPMQATLHRAFDKTVDPFQSLEEAVGCGFSRILTSGQKPSALEGALLVSELIKKSGNRISLMPGGGVRAENIAELKRTTGAKEFHSSAINAKTMFVDENEIRKMKNLLSL